MRISQVDLFEVSIPPIPPIAAVMPKIYDITLVRIMTDEGLTGWGECQGRKADLETRFQSYVGQDPLAIDAFAQTDAINCALLDIAGQAWGVPMWRLFGAQVRDRVPVSYWSCPMEPAQTAAEAEVGARAGFTNHKLKARPWNIVETIRLMKEATGPDYTVGVDPNTMFVQPSVAARLANELEPFGTVANFEDPVLKDNLDWYRLLREKTWIPLALHLGAPSGVLAALKAEAVDYVNLGGAAAQVRKSAALAEAANVPIWVQMGGLCLGILAAYSVHLQSTLAAATLACDELPHMRVADITDGSLQLADGHFVVPEGPGLGVHIDEKVIEAYRVA
ncbi:MAG TPA: enolase C-terminal domain-like protein [Candidatus Latescibacteria bacterium]|nr:enolase C-terminal domain-like protein [Candidatus Latescibacterota bacterium]